jgi:transposase, IS30 family
MAGVQHPDTMDEHRGGPGRHLTGNPWSAGCAETRSSGAEGGPGKRAGRDPGTAPRSDPYITGASNRSAIGTLVDRASRYTILLHLPGRHTAEVVRDALITVMSALPPQLRRSLTWDQGKEMALHAEITAALGMPVYFCDKASPWQRPSNENTNGLLRQYFPKGSDLRAHGPGDLAAVAAELNARPRKTLGWDTPAGRLGL